MVKSWGEVPLQSLLKLCTFLLTLTAFAGLSLSAQEQEKAATDAATPWLALVDSGQYGESWFQASSDFRGAASKEQWIHALNTVRAPLGKLVSRQLKSATYTTKLPNTHPGEYMVVQYDTSYEKAPGMLEVVVMAKEKTGTWKVSGYFIKRPGQ
jgi:Protein of unknown function (DUF4019)